MSTIWPNGKSTHLRPQAEQNELAPENTCGDWVQVSPLAIPGLFEGHRGIRSALLQAKDPSSPPELAALRIHQRPISRMHLSALVLAAWGAELDPGHL